MGRRITAKLAERELHFFWLVDASGSMSVDGKMAQLNTAIRGAIEPLREEAARGVGVAVLVRAVVFAHDASWHISEPTPLDEFEWDDVAIVEKGTTELGRAIDVVTEELVALEAHGRGVPPVMVLVSDGRPTDFKEPTFGAAMRRLDSTLWGRKASRIAIGIGADADEETLRRFIGHDEVDPIQVDNPGDLVNYIRWATTEVVGSAIGAVRQQPTSVAEPEAVEPEAVAPEPVPVVEPDEPADDFDLTPAPVATRAQVEAAVMDDAAPAEIELEPMPGEIQLEPVVEEIELLEDPSAEPGFEPVPAPVVSEDFDLVEPAVIEPAAVEPEVAPIVLEEPEVVEPEVVEPGAPAIVLEEPEVASIDLVEETVGETAPPPPPPPAPGQSFSSGGGEAVEEEAFEQEDAEPQPKRRRLGGDTPSAPGQVDSAAEQPPLRSWP